ncbi:MAG: hypothetical protein ABSH08_04735 [Tepidisphaeraceae bacterium]|jgi:hypothetical protein
MPTIATHIQRLLKKTERMKQQAVRSLLRTLKQIEQERKARTVDLEEAAKVILKQLADLGHVGINTKAAATKAKRTATIGKKRRKIARRQFAVSGEQLILNFVKSKSNPIGRDIEKHWASEGRAGTAANLISKLVKERRLKRTPLKDERGSRYSLA